jgi:hypothetical protein
MAPSIIEGQEIPINKSSIDFYGCIQVQVESFSDYYYALYCRPDLQSNTEWTISMTLGEEGTTTLSEPLAAYPADHYRLLQYRRENSQDHDKDGLDDVRELLDLGPNSPLNPAKEISYTL